MTTQEAFDLYHQAVFSFVYRLTRRADFAEDITQECFVAYLKAPERFNPARGSSLKHYLIAIARNLALKSLRDNGRESQISSEVELASGFDPACDISKAVENAISSLPPLQQEALILFEYEGFTLDEIGAMAGVDVGTVKSRLHRARERLRRELAAFKRVGDLSGRP